MKLVAGRPFTDRDVAGAPRVAIVNEAFARAFFGGRNPLGRRIVNREKFDLSQACEIVGVVRDFKYNDLRQEARSMFFVLIFQSESEFNSIQVRTDANPLGSVEPVRRLIRTTARLLAWLRSSPVVPVWLWSVIVPFLSPVRTMVIVTWPP